MTKKQGFAEKPVAAEAESATVKTGFLSSFNPFFIRVFRPKANFIEPNVESKVKLHGIALLL